jgi:hypothetical protein
MQLLRRLYVQDRRVVARVVAEAVLVRDGAMCLPATIGGQWLIAIRIVISIIQGTGGRKSKSRGRSKSNRGRSRMVTRGP